MTLKVYKLKKNQVTIKESKKVFNFLSNNIKNSIFVVLGHEYFLELLKINYQNCFYIKKNNKIVSYISYINNEKEEKMKKILIKFLFKKFINIFLIIFNFKFFFKIHSPPTNFIQLVHLVIKLNKGDNNLKIQLHARINRLHQQVIISKYRGIYAAYDNKNIIASKYYKKNNFKVFKNNFFYTFVKKKI